MSARDRLRAALAGADDLAFVPRAWSRLPAFVRAGGSTESADFWGDPARTHRMLSDAAALCSADGMVVPLPPAIPPGPDVLADAGVEATLALLERVRAVGSHGLVIELPTLDRLGEAWPGAVSDDVEDALSDLVRAGMEAGADAAAVRGEEAAVTRTLALVTPLAGYFGAPVAGQAGDAAWFAPGGPEAASLSRDGRWPALARGVVLTAGDLTEWWSPDEVRAVVAERDHARG